MSCNPKFISNPTEFTNPDGVDGDTALGPTYLAQPG